MQHTRMLPWYGYDADSSEHCCKALTIISLIKGPFQRTPNRMKTFGSLVPHYNILQIALSRWYAEQ